MAAAVNLSVADRFAQIIEGLCEAVVAWSFGRPIGPAGLRGAVLAGPVVIVIWNRLRRMAARFVALAARAQAGSLRPARERAARPAAFRYREPAAGVLALPRDFAWLIRLSPGATAAASQLQFLLADPEMAGLIAAAPQLGRILRPLCRALGIEPGPPVPPAPKRARPGPAVPASAAAARPAAPEIADDRAGAGHPGMSAGEPGSLSGEKPAGNGTLPAEPPPAEPPPAEPPPAEPPADDERHPTVGEGSLRSRERG